MSSRVKIILYASLILCAIVFAACFSHENTRVLNGVANASKSSMMGYGVGFFCVVVALGLIGAYDIVHLVGDKTEELLLTDAEEESHDPEYLQAEQVRADGDPLEAIRLLRDY